MFWASVCITEMKWRASSKKPPVAALLLSPIQAKISGVEALGLARGWRVHGKVDYAAAAAALAQCQLLGGSLSSWTWIGNRKREHMINPTYFCPILRQQQLGGHFHNFWKVEVWKHGTPHMALSQNVFKYRKFHGTWPRTWLLEHHHGMLLLCRVTMT